MRPPYSIFIIIIGFVVLFVPVIFYYPTVTNPTPETTNIPASADVSTLEPPNTKRIIVVLPVKPLLDVGFNATYEMPVTSFIRFDLTGLQHSDLFTTVTFSAKLVLLGSSAFPENISNTTDYIVTASQIECDDPNWRDTDMTTFTCFNYDNSTASSILIRGDSIPDFYEWVVTSAVEKALKDKQNTNQVTFRIAGYPLTADNFNGGVQFWSKETASYVGSYAGPAEWIIVASETAPSHLSNMLVTIGSIVAIGGIVWSLTEIVWRRRGPRPKGVTS